MTGPNRQLVLDLAKLAARYPPEDWQELVDCLEDKLRRKQLTRLLGELAQASRARRGPTSGSHTQSRASRLRQSLVAVRREDPDRADLFEERWKKLRQRDLLPTMGAVRAFADAAGLKGLESTRREQAIPELLSHLIELPVAESEQMMRQTVIHDRKLGDEYASWVRLILDRKGLPQVERP
jgi:hypothetical protein